MRWVESGLSSRLKSDCSRDEVKLYETRSRLHDPTRIVACAGRMAHAAVPSTPTIAQVESGLTELECSFDAAKVKRASARRSKGSLSVAAGTGTGEGPSRVTIGEFKH
jgi:hypothetical protein